MGLEFLYFQGAFSRQEEKMLEFGAWGLGGFARARGAESASWLIARASLNLAFTHRPQSSSFLGLPYRILNMNPQKELLWGLWVMPLMSSRTSAGAAK